MINSFYQCKSRVISGQSYGSIYKIAWRIYSSIKSKSKRRPYIKSAYFETAKVFLDNFWPHLNQKNVRDRKRRLRYFECALELIQRSKKSPIYEGRGELKKEFFYRFLGKVESDYFIVQIKEDKRRGQKFFMSVFEYKQK